MRGVGASAELDPPSTAASGAGAFCVRPSSRIRWNSVAPVSSRGLGARLGAPTPEMRGSAGSESVPFTFWTNCPSRFTCGIFAPSPPIRGPTAYLPRTNTNAGTTIHLQNLPKPVSSLAMTSPVYPPVHSSSMPEDPKDDEILILENPVVRLELSRRNARVVAWTEKATGLPLLDAPVGLELEDFPPDPLGSLASVEEPEEGEDAPPEHLLYDPFGHGGVAVQILYHLDPEANALAAEIALTNRTLVPIPLRLRWHGPAASFDPPTFARVEGGWADGFVLAGRTTATFAVRAAAFGADLARATGAEAAVGWDPEVVTVRVARPHSDARLFLRTESGETLEAPAPVGPERALVLPLGGVRPVAAVLRSAEGIDLAAPPELSPPTEPSPPEPTVAWSDLTLADLARLARSPATRHLAALERARRAALEGDDGAADAALDDALLWNADDPLLWWTKAALQRRLDPSRDRAEWLNARFLRPLEPLVAAEALLAQEPEGPEGDNPLMRLVAGREAVAAGCVAAYAEAGHVRDATALAARILAVRDWRRVRLLAAGLYLVHTRMAVQASEHRSAALRAERETDPPDTGVEATYRALLDARFGAIS